MNKPQIIVGFVESRKLEKDELDQDEDEDLEEDDFEFSVSGVKSVIPEIRIVKMLIINDGTTVHVKCRLPWTWSWLQATIELKYPITKYKSAGQQLIDRSFNVIQYHLNPSKGAKGHSACVQFLDSLRSTKDEAGGGDITTYSVDYKREFGYWLHLETKSDPTSTSLPNLMALLEKFESFNNPAAQLISQLISNSQAGRVWSLATNYPTFFRAAPILFPRKIMSILPAEDDDLPEVRLKEKLLAKLEEITKEDPWKMGFSDVMYIETSKSGLEATYSAIKSAWFYQDLEDIQKKSLQLYDAMKTTCRNKGHTYLKHEDMKLWFNNYLAHRKRLGRGCEDEESAPTNLYDAVMFLENQKVVMRQVKDGQERLHLARYWRAEEGICSHIQELLKGEAWTLPVDLDSAHFDRIKTDADQMRAAKCIQTKPLAMISGRGGTGKTEVVSAVLGYAEREIDYVGDVNDNSWMTNDDDFPALDEEPSKYFKEKAVEELLTDDEDGEQPNQVKQLEDQDLFSEDDEELNAICTDKKKAKEETGSTNGPILYCAPTGKAANVIKKRVGKKAFTIHQVLSSWNKYLNGGKLGTWKFSETRIVAVDECSMVSIELFHWLLKYLKEGSRLQKIVLLGDHLQLPSVDPGNFMADLHSALNKKGMVVELKTCHRSEGNLIFENATRISGQRAPEFDSVRGFRLIVPTRKDFNSLPGSVKQGAVLLNPAVDKPMETITKYKGGVRMSAERREMYWSLLRSHRTEFKIEDDQTSQIISFINRDCETLNQFGCYVYNKHNVYNLNENKRLEKQFHIRDKVMCTKNSDISVYEEESVEEEDGKGELDELGGILQVQTDGTFEEPTRLVLREKVDRLMNGSLFKIRAVVSRFVKKPLKENEGDDKLAEAMTTATNGTSGGDEVSGENTRAEYYVLDDLTGEIVRANTDLIRKKCKLSHAWALSIHKFQGSEADTIVYALSGSKHETWQHVYTAVTRGKKNVVILGTYQELLEAVKRKPFPRQTALGEKMRSLIFKVEKEERERIAALQSINSDKLEQNDVSKDKTKLRDKSPIRKYLGTQRADPESPSKLLARLSVSAKKSPPTRAKPNIQDGGTTDHEATFDDDDGFEEAFSQLNESLISGPPAKHLGSPGKRKSTASTSIDITPTKLQRSNTAVDKPGAAAAAAAASSGGLSSIPSRLVKPVVKRLAECSPASYHKECQVRSPANYSGSSSGKNLRESLREISTDRSLEKSYSEFGELDSEDELVLTQALDQAEAMN